MTVRKAGALALLIGFGACASPKANVWNLQQVHRPDGGASYSGNLRSDLEARIFGLGDLGQVGGQRLPNVAQIFGIETATSEDAEPIEDPYAVAMENLLALAAFDAEDNEETRALQVEIFGWLAADSAYPLVRERATLELGPLGRLLAEDETPPLRDLDAAIGPDELKVLLKALVGAVRGNGDLDDSSKDLLEANLDRNGLRRALRTVTILRFSGSNKTLRLRGGGLGQTPSLVELHDELQRRFVSETLQVVLNDPVGMVRAAALQAAVVGSDNSVPALIQAAIVRAREEVVEVRALDLLQKYGIPKWDQLNSAEEEEQYRRSWTDLCVGKLRSAFDGPVAIAAAQALKRLAPQGPDSLRMEDWALWYEQTLEYGEGQALTESSLSE